MQNYLRAIGFSTIKSLHQLDRIHKDIQRNPDRRNLVSRSLQTSLVQMEKTYAPEGLGIMMIGESDAEGHFLFEYSFPYVLPGPYPYTDEIQIEKQNDRSGYYGLIDNINLSVIFTVQNLSHITGSIWRDSLPSMLSLQLSGLSLGANILLPLRKTEQDLQYEAEKRRENLSRIHLVRHGHPEILDQMMMSEMDTRDTIDHRIATEDVLSIVDSSMIPSGLQSDVYDILGTILQVQETKNSMTGEQICIMDVACLYYVIRIAVNRRDLVGEPVAGRRFRGITWLQGLISLDRYN